MGRHPLTAYRRKTFGTQRLRAHLLPPPGDANMPRYRFHLYNSEESRDQEGRVFPDLAAAHTDAITNARALMCDDMCNQGEIHLRHWIEIEEEDGTLSVVSFSEAVIVSS